MLTSIESYQIFFLPFHRVFCSVEGQRYFTCKPKYGSMIPIPSVEVGDYPPEDDGLDDDEI